MAVYIVQHGKCLPKTDDPEKGLTAEGKEETHRIAGVAKGYAVTVDRIVHSGKKRARETAEIFAAYLSPANGLDTRSDMNPLDDVSSFVDQLPLDRQIMLVGHLPFLERLIAVLVGGGPERPVFKLQNSGIVCVDRDDRSGRAVICWALMPTIG